MANADLARKYSAFISYRHADNRLEGRRWAEWLHQAIETYEVPADLVGSVNQRSQAVPASLFPVFRDEEELPADADLTANIRRALENSDALIVLCSPQACASRFVHEEICYFKELGNSARILSVLLEGEPNASDDPGKQAAGFTAAQECLPLALRIGAPGADGAVDWEARAEPIAADVRPQGLPEQGWTTPAAYRSKRVRASVFCRCMEQGWTTPAAYRSVLLQQDGHSPQEVDGLVREYSQRLELAVRKIVAGLLGVPLGLLTERDKARQLERARQEAARLRRLVAIFVALTAVAAAAGIFAWTQKRRADEEAARELRAQNVAQEQTKVAEKQTQVAREQTEVAVKALEDTRQAQQKERDANERRRQLLSEASTSDRLTGLGVAGTDKERDAFAYFSRAITYDPASTVAAEAVFTFLNTFSVTYPATTLRPEALPPRGNLNDARFTADGKRIFLFQRHNDTAALWGAENGQPLIPLKDAITEGGGQLCNDGQHILTTATTRSDGGDKPPKNIVRLWDAATGKLLATLSDLWTATASARLSPDGRRIVTVSKNLTAQVWDLASGQPLAMLADTPNPGARTPPQTPGLATPGAPKPPAWRGVVYSARFSPDGQRIVSRAMGNRRPNPLPNSVGQVDAAAVVWDAATGNLLASLELPERLTPLPPFPADADRLDAQFSPDGRRILCTWGQVVYLADAATGRLLATLALHTDTITSARFSPDGSTILTASYDRTARLWDGETGALITTFEGHGDWVNDAEFSPDGKRFVTASNDRTAKVYERTDSNKYRKLTTLRGHDDALNSARFSPDNRHIVTTSDDGTAMVWNCRDAAAAATFPPVADVTTLKDYNPDDYRFEHSPAGSRLLTRLAAEKQLTCGRFSIDGHRFFAGGGTPSEGLVQVWEVKSDKLLFSIPGHAGMVNGLDVSADDKLLVTASSDKTARVWQTDTGRSVSILRGHREEVSSADFRRDGQRVVTYSKDGTIRLWNTTSGELVGILPGVSAHGTTDRGVLGLHKSGRLMIFTASGSPVDPGYNGIPAGPRFTADGEHITVGMRSVGGKKGEYMLNTAPSLGATPTVFTLLPADAAAPPDWFVDFLRYLGRRRFNETGELADLSAEDCLVIHDRLRKKDVESAGQDTPYLRLLRRLIPKE